MSDSENSPTLQDNEARVMQLELIAFIYGDYNKR